MLPDPVLTTRAALLILLRVVLTLAPPATASTSDAVNVLINFLPFLSSRCAGAGRRRIRGEREPKGNAITTLERYTLCGGNTNDDSVGTAIGLDLSQRLIQPSIRYLSNRKYSA